MLHKYFFHLNSHHVHAQYFCTLLPQESLVTLKTEFKCHFICGTTVEWLRKWSKLFLLLDPQPLPLNFATLLIKKQSLFLFPLYTGSCCHLLWPTECFWNDHDHVPVLSLELKGPWVLLLSSWKASLAWDEPVLKKTPKEVSLPS